MANLTQMGIDPNVKATTGFEVIPEGKYIAVITGDEIKPTKTGGQMLVFKLQIIEGEYKGTEITDRINILNASPKAQAIGQGILKNICNILESPFPPADTSRLYGVPIGITVRIEEFASNSTGETLQSNKISAYSKPVTGGATVKAGGAW